METIIIHAGKWTRRGCLFETLEGLLVTEVSDLAKILEFTLHTLEILRTLHSANDLLGPSSFSNIIQSGVSKVQEKSLGSPMTKSLYILVLTGLNVRVKLNKN